jgi:hypothetical protein
MSAAEIDLIPLSARLATDGKVVFSPSPSMLGMSLSTKLVHSGLPPSLLRSRTMAFGVSSKRLLRQLSTVPLHQAGVRYRGCAKLDTVNSKDACRNESDIDSDDYFAVRRAILVAAAALRPCHLRPDTGCHFS